MNFRFLEKFQATLDKLFSVGKSVELKEIRWDTPADALDALLMLFDIQDDFQKPDGTQHPRPVRYIRHKRRAGSPYRRKRVPVIQNPEPSYVAGQVFWIKSASTNTGVAHG